MVTAETEWCEITDTVSGWVCPVGDDTSIKGLLYCTVYSTFINYSDPRSPRQVLSYTLLQQATRATREVGDLCDLDTLRSRT
jgi:hypothetical protein